MSNSTHVIVMSGCIGHDANIGSKATNGRIPVRISIPMQERADEQTTWVPVYYWSSSDSEIEFLRSSLLKGATVSVQGTFRIRRTQHQDFPVDVTTVSLEATSVTVLAPPRAPAPARHAQHDERAMGDEFGDQTARYNTHSPRPAAPVHHAPAVAPASPGYRSHSSQPAYTPAAAAPVAAAPAAPAHLLNF